MVDTVHAPEEWHMVHSDMLCPDSEIHDQESGDGHQPDRRIDKIKHAKPGLIGQKRDAREPGRQYQTAKHGARNEDRTRPRPALGTRKRRLTPGGQHFQKHKRDENPRKYAHPNEGLLIQILPVRGLPSQYESARP